MTKTYHVTSGKRVVNRFMQTLIRIGIAPKGMHVLMVAGRKSDKLYSTPVTLVEQGSDRWLVAPYGEVGWVRNARATGQVALRHGRRMETVSVTEVSPSERAPVLKQYVKREPITRPYFDAGPDSPLETFAAEASRHPVFHIQANPHSS